MADTSKYTIEERLIVSVWVREKNELTKRTKKSETFFFVSIKQLPVKPISEKPRPHNVRQLTMVLLKKNLSIIRVDSVEQLKREIIRILRTISPEMLRRASRRTWRRIQLWAENDGAHTET